jgi:hypothetical protein
MPRYAITGPEPDAIDFGPVLADTPLEALHLVHAEALGERAVQIVDGQLVFADPADAEECAGSWTVTAFGPAGAATTTIEIALKPGSAGGAYAALDRGAVPLGVIGAVVEPGILTCRQSD